MQIFGSNFGICGALSAVPSATSPSSSCVRRPIGSMANSTIHQMMG